MKKSFLLSLLISTVSLTLFSQTKTIEIPVDGSTEDVQHIPGKGFVFHTQAAAANFSTITKGNIVFIDEQMNTVWNKNVKAPLKNVSWNLAFTSLNSTGVYWFFYEKGAVKGKKIDWEGNEEEIEIKDADEKANVKELGSNASFMDKDVLFNIQYTLNKDVTTTTMYTVDFKTKNVQNTPLALPARPNYSYGWVFMGEGDGKIYFKSMNKPDGKSNTITTLIAVIDHSGKLISSSEFTLDFSPKFPYLLFNSQDYNGAHFPYAQSGDDEIYRYSPVKLSSDKKFIYLYSFVRDETGLSKKKTGYMIAKYSIEGEKIWQNIYPFQAPVLSDKVIILHGSNNSLNAYFNVNDEKNTVDFHFWDILEKKTYHAIASAADGNLIDFFKTDNPTWAYSGSSYTAYGGHTKQIHCHHCVPPQAVPVTSKGYNKELVTFISENSELSFVKKVGKNFFIFDRYAKKGSDGLKVYLFEGKQVKNKTCMLYISILLYFGFSYLIAEKIGKHKTIGFWKTFVLCLVTSPFIGYLVAEGGGRKDARGCNWCGNKYNEAVFCGLCGKNETGEIRPGFVPKNKS